MEAHDCCIQDCFRFRMKMCRGWEFYIYRSRSTAGVLTTYPSHPYCAHEPLSAGRTVSTSSLRSAYVPISMGPWLTINYSFFLGARDGPSPAHFRTLFAVTDAAGMTRANQLRGRPPCGLPCTMSRGQDLAGLTKRAALWCSRSRLLHCKERSPLQGP